MQYVLDVCETESAEQLAKSLQKSSHHYRCHLSAKHGVWAILLPGASYVLPEPFSFVLLWVHPSCKC